MIPALIQLGCMFAALSVLSAYLIIKLPRPYWIRAVAIPLILTIGLLGFYDLPNVMGYPYENYPTGDFTVSAVELQNSGRPGPPDILFVAHQHGKSRLYEIPFDPAVLQAMMDAIKADGEGEGQTVLNFGSGKNGHGERPGWGPRELNVKFVPLVQTLPGKGK